MNCSPAYWEARAWSELAQAGHTAIKVAGFPKALADEFEEILRLPDDFNPLD